jgi:hypothetical protein
LIATEPDPATLQNDGAQPSFKLAPALMHIENLSLASLSRGPRGVGVTDLREALSGRSSMSNPALVPPGARPESVTTADGAPSVLAENPLARTRSRHAQTKKRLASGPSEVRDVLNKLVGKQNGSALLKAPFGGNQPMDRKM